MLSLIFLYIFLPPVVIAIVFVIRQNKKRRAQERFLKEFEKEYPNSKQKKNSKTDL